MGPKSSSSDSSDLGQCRSCVNSGFMYMGGGFCNCSAGTRRQAASKTHCPGAGRRCKGPSEQAHHSLHHCNICKENIPAGHHAFACLTCKWDMCMKCKTGQEFKAANPNEDLSKIEGILVTLTIYRSKLTSGKDLNSSERKILD